MAACRSGAAVNTLLSGLQPPDQAILEEFYALFIANILKILHERPSCTGAAASNAATKCPRLQGEHDTLAVLQI